MSQKETGRSRWFCSLESVNQRGSSLQTGARNPRLDPRGRARRRSVQRRAREADAPGHGGFEGKRSKNESLSEESESRGE